MQQMTSASSLNPNSALSLGSEINVRGVSKSYGAEQFAKQVIRNCNFTLERGKLTVMIGPSGCGKSTLIRLLAGFERPTSGTITVDGKPMTGPGVDRLVVFQETALFPWMSTYDNIMYGPRARGEDTPEMREHAEMLLQKVGLTAFRKKYPSQLSGGMQRRAELARAMINKPSVMILDEPFRGLDAMTKRLMQEYYANLYERIRTHDLLRDHRHRRGDLSRRPHPDHDQHPDRGARLDRRQSAASPQRRKHHRKRRGQCDQDAGARRCCTRRR